MDLKHKSLKGYLFNMMTDRAKNVLCALAGLLILLLSGPAFSQAVIEVGKFSAVHSLNKTFKIHSILILN